MVEVGVDPPEQSVPTIFSRIIAGEIPSTRVYEDDQVSIVVLHPHIQIVLNSRLNSAL
jgi:hypothetical protein